MCLRHQRLEKRLEHYPTPAVSGFQGMAQASYHCSSRFRAVALRRSASRCLRKQPSQVPGQAPTSLEGQGRSPEAYWTSVRTRGASPSPLPALAASLALSASAAASAAVAAFSATAASAASTAAHTSSAAAASCAYLRGQREGRV